MLVGSVSQAAPLEPHKRLATAVLTQTAPTIDGRLDDAVWNNSQEFSGFTQIAKDNPPAKHPTFVRALYDGRNLYLGFRCIQARNTLVAAAANEGPVWTDDCIELFLTPHIATTLLQTRFPAEQFFHLVFNSAGTKFDELGTGGGSSWDAPWEVKTSVHEGEWQAEVVVPFSTLYGVERAPEPFTSWNVQFCRSAVADPEYTTLFPGFGLYRQKNNFGYLIFLTEPQNEPTIRWNLDRQNEAGPRLKKLSDTAAAMKPLPGTRYGEQISAQQQSINQLSSWFGKLSPNSYDTATQAGFLTKLNALEGNTRVLQEQMVLQKAAAQKSSVVLVPHAAVKDSQLVKPDFLPELDSIGRPVSVTVTTEQYQAASFVFWTKSTARNVLAQVSDLKNISAKTAKPLPGAATVDVRWVKVWYQAGVNDIVAEGNVLTPELLLKNPDLVKVDLKAQKNITRITPKMTGRGYPSDAATLQPLAEVPARTAMQGWLTIRVPKGTPPGRYRGTIRLVSGSNQLAQMPIEITVLDFSLAPSMLEHNWYTRSVWGIKTDGQTPERALAEVKNLAQHGVTSVGLIEHLETFPEAAAIMKKGGLSTEKIYVVGETGNARFEPGLDPAIAEQRAAQWMQLAKAAGGKELFLYLEDEARGETLRSMRPIAEAIRRAGAKTWVACYPDYFPIAGDVIDRPVMSGGMVSQELVSKIHAAGSRIFSYGNPQGGVEKPEIYRRNYGLNLWQNNYDGAFDFVYYAGFGPYIADWNPWDDFTHPYWRQHCMVYPTQNGVVDTIQWEGWREGVTDCRYLATLQKEITRARIEKRATAAADKADAWINALKSGGQVALRDLDVVRDEMIRHIQAVRKGR